MRVLGEGAGSGVSGTLKLPALLVHHDHGGGALGHLVSPLAAPGHLVIRQAGRAVVPVGLKYHVIRSRRMRGQYSHLAVLTFPEHAAVLGVGECSPEPGAVVSGDRGLELRPLAALDQVELGALLQGEGGVGVQEAQAIAAGPQLRAALLTMPVFVATRKKTDVMKMMWGNFNLNQD